MGAGSLCDDMVLRSSIVSHSAGAAVLLRVEPGQRSANDAFGSKPAQEPNDGEMLRFAQHDIEVAAQITIQSPGGGEGKWGRKKFFTAKNVVRLGSPP
jgi:hypothetical protein